MVGFASGRIPSVPANMPLIKGFSVVGVRAGEYGRKDPERGRAIRLDDVTAALAGRNRMSVRCSRDEQSLLAQIVDDARTRFEAV